MLPNTSTCMYKCAVRGETGFLLVSVRYAILCHALPSLVLKCACAILYHWFVFWQDANSFFVISREKRDNFILIKEIFK